MNSLCTLQVLNVLKVNMKVIDLLKDHFLLHNKMYINIVRSENQPCTHKICIHLYFAVELVDCNCLLKLFKRLAPLIYFITC